jgi:hypothetical protein
MIRQIQHPFDARLQTEKGVSYEISLHKKSLGFSTCNPEFFACSNVMDFPCEILISPGVDIERKQQEKRSNSHHELINRQI